MDNYNAWPCLTISILIIISSFIIVIRYINYRQTLALAEKGLLRPSETVPGDGKDALRWGIIITAIGCALFVGTYPIGFWVAKDVPLHVGPWLLAGLVPIFFGLGLILIYVLTRNGKKPPVPPTEPPPVA